MGQRSTLTLLPQLALRSAPRAVAVRIQELREPSPSSCPVTLTRLSWSQLATTSSRLPSFANLHWPRGFVLYISPEEPIPNNNTLTDIEEAVGNRCQSTYSVQSAERATSQAQPSVHIADRPWPQYLPSRLNPRLRPRTPPRRRSRQCLQHHPTRPMTTTRTCNNVNV